MSLAVYRELRAKRRGTWTPPPPVPVPAPVVYPAVLPGTRILRETPIVDSDGTRYGWELLVASPDLTVTVAAFQAAVPAIAAAFGTIDEAVTVWPTDRNTLVRVRVVESWWIREQEAAREARMDAIHPWPGPTLDVGTGRFQFGVCADGTPTWWRLWVPEDGARHGWFIGRTGGGKTGTMGTALLSAVTTGVVLPVVVDMQGGASLGEWRDRGVPYADNLDDALVLLRRLALEADRRAQWMADGCGTGMPVKWLPTPTREVPFILPVLDEFPALAAHPEGSEAVGKGLREWRKLMIGAWIATQGHQAHHAFGWNGGDIARQQIKAGNVCQLNGSVNSMVEALDIVDDMSGLGMIPRGQQGGYWFRGPDHPDVVRGRGLYERDVAAALDRWADIPDYDLPQLPGHQATAQPVDPATAASCEEAVTVMAAGVGPGDVLETSAVLRALGGRWKERTVYDALASAAADGVLVKTGRGEWTVQ